MIIRILTQTFENYSCGEYHPIWKAKHPQEFFVDSEKELEWLYEEDLCIAAVKSLLAEKETTLFKYEYVSHEIVFEPIKLNGFSERLNTLRTLGKASSLKS